MLQDEKEMTLNELITELYEVLTDVMAILNLQTDYGIFTEKQFIFKVYTCTLMLTSIATQKQEKCLLPHQVLEKLIASDQLSNVSSGKIIEHLNAQLKSLYFSNLFKYHLELLLEIELQHLDFLRENNSKEQKNVFVNDIIIHLEEEFIAELPIVVKPALPQELILLSYFYADMRLFYISCIYIEFMAKPIEDMKTQLQLEYIHFLIENDIQDHFKGLDIYLEKF